MGFICLDVCFVFSNYDLEKLVSLSSSLKDSKFYLSEDNLPHLSLSKILVNEDRVEDLKLKINNFLKENSLPNLKINGFKSESLENKKTSCLFVEKTDELISFQKKLVDEIYEFNCEKKVLKKMFFEDVNSLTISWFENAILNFRRDYNPHISLGFGILENIDNFELNDFNLEVCEVGNFCTCKNILK